MGLLDELEARHVEGRRRCTVTLDETMVVTFYAPSLTCGAMESVQDAMRAARAAQPGAYPDSVLSEHEMACIALANMAEDEDGNKLFPEDDAAERLRTRVDAADVNKLSAELFPSLAGLEDDAGKEYAAAS